MVKTIISTILAFLLLLAGAILEKQFITREFDEFEVALTSLYQKAEEEIAVKEDVYAVQANWLSKKKKLHAVIPHTEIKEVDLWLSEAVMLVRDKEWTDALSKIEVLLELCEQIPQTFSLSFQNIF